MTIRTGVLALLLAPALVCAQQVRVDPSTGDYFVTVYDDNHDPVELQLIPANKVIADIEIEVVDSAPGYLYRFRVDLPVDGPQGLGTFMISCPNQQGAYGGLVGNPDPPDAAGPWIDYQGENPAGQVCEFSGGAVPLPPGESLLVEINSVLLPGIGTAFLVGGGAGFVGEIPTTDAATFDENLEALRFELTVNGTDGGWKELPSVAPSRNQTIFDEPLSGLALIEGDLNQVCGSLQWISSGAVCDSLSATVAEAASSITTGSWLDARGQVTQALETLEANYDEDGGGAVERQPFYLLSTNLRALLAALPNPPTAVVSSGSALLLLSGEGSQDPEGGVLECRSADLQLHRSN